MANKKNQKVEEYAKAEKQAYTVKVTTIFKTLGVLALLVGAFIAGHQVAVQDQYTFENATSVKAEKLVQKLNASKE